MKKDRVYISLPMGGHEDTVKERYDKACETLKKIYNDNFPNVKLEIVAPGNIDDFTEDGYIGEERKPWEYYIGEDVKILLTCNGIYMTEGWKTSKGCKVELAVASQHVSKIFGLKKYNDEVAYIKGEFEEFEDLEETITYNKQVEFKDDRCKVDTVITALY